MIETFSTEQIESLHTLNAVVRTLGHLEQMEIQDDSGKREEDIEAGKIYAADLYYHGTRENGVKKPNLSRSSQWNTT